MDAGPSAGAAEARPRERDAQVQAGVCRGPGPELEDGGDDQSQMGHGAGRCEDVRGEESDIVDTMIIAQRERGRKAGMRSDHFSCCDGFADVNYVSPLSVILTPGEISRVVRNKSYWTQICASEEPEKGYIPCMQRHRLMPLGVSA